MHYTPDTLLRKAEKAEMRGNHIAAKKFRSMARSARRNWTAKGIGGKVTS